jgi:hypothetical protein
MGPAIRPVSGRAGPMPTLWHRNLRFPASGSGAYTFTYKEFPRYLLYKILKSGTNRSMIRPVRIVFPRPGENKGAEVMVGVVPAISARFHTGYPRSIQMNTNQNRKFYMDCYQVTTQYAIIQNKAVLVSIHTKKQEARAFLIQSWLPFGSGLKYSRFFKTKEEASEYVSYINTVYKNRVVSYPALPGGQLYLFQEVSR